ncbi:hypothetical protein [Paenibacillus antibioticophila]|nr:hypothetical protein [Paenibacillus antibioticophila]
MIETGEGEYNCPNCGFTAIQMSIGGLSDMGEVIEVELITHKARCRQCKETFFEISGEEADECPSCGTSLFEENTVEEIGTEWHEVSIDRGTGELILGKLFNGEKVIRNE